MQMPAGGAAWTAGVHHPPSSFPCTGVYPGENEFAIRITQLGIRKPVCLHLGHTSANSTLKNYLANGYEAAVEAAVGGQREGRCFFTVS